MRHGDAEFAEIKLELAKVFPLDDQKRSCFAISSNNSVTQFYARTIQDRDEWVKYIAIVINNLSEETQVCFDYLLLLILFILILFINNRICLLLKYTKKT